MKLGTFKKLCLTVMGVGVVGSLVSVGTFASFTATTTNPGNTFAAGTLTLQDTTGYTSAATTLGAAAPNLTAVSPFDPRTTVATCETPSSLIGSVCTTLLRSANVAGAGMEPGQYLQGTITVKNSGTLPATVAMQIQNVSTTNGSGTTPSLGACASDISSVIITNKTGSFTGCSDIGNALAITISDAGGSGGSAHCVYGGFDGSTTANGANAAPIASGTTGLKFAVPTSQFVAGGTDSTSASTSGACDVLSNTSSPDNLGTAASPATLASSPLANDLFGPSGTSLSSFAKLNGTLSGANPTNLIFIPGTSTTKSLTNSATFGGQLNTIPQWKAGESHTFTITIAFPDTGVHAVTTNGDTYNVSNDEIFQGGAVKFDLVWLATQ